MAASKLKIAGAWSGVIEVDLDAWTVPMLREEVHRRSGVGPGRTISLICGGKVLKDCDGVHTLSRAGLKNNSKVLATAVSPDRGEVFDREAKAEADRSSKLNRLRAAAVALAERHTDGSLPVEDFNMELEDQNGQKVNLGSESDHKGVMTGLMLHSNAKALIQKQNYKDALDVLIMGELCSIAELLLPFSFFPEAFALCDPKLIEMIDNVPMLQLDIVWCYFMLRDVSCLSVAGERLAQARKGFERAHGKNSARLRLLQAGRPAELAIYLRLELLEGVVAYHSGKYEESRKALSSAQDKYVQLQVPDEALSLLMNMGYKEKDAKMAWRMSGQNIQNAVDFLFEQEAKRTRRREEDIKRHQEIMEQKKYGTTPLKKAVDIQRLNELVSIGFERCLAAEALRLNENDTELSLDLLTDPVKNSALQHKLESRKAKASESSTAGARMDVGQPPVADAAMEGSSSAAAAEAADAAATEGSVADADAAAAAAAAMEGSVADADAAAAAAAAAAASPENDRDEEMEEQIARELTQDALADYNIEVSKEGDAIAEYFSLLEYTVNGSSRIP